MRLGSAIEPDWLLELSADRVEEVDRRAFDPNTDRVERTTGLRYGALMLDETVAPAPLDEETARLLADAVLARGLERLPGGDALPPLLHRLAFARRQMPERVRVGWRRRASQALVRAACVGRGSVAALGDPAALVLSALPPAAQQALRAAAPERITLGSGRSVPVHYDAGDTPWIESRLQDFFGTRAVPALGAGARGADGAPAGAERARRAGDARSRKLLDAALPGAAPPAEPALSRNTPGPRTAPPPSHRPLSRRATENE